MAAWQNLQHQLAHPTGIELDNTREFIRFYSAIKHLEDEPEKRDPFPCQNCSLQKINGNVNCEECQFANPVLVPRKGRGLDGGEKNACPRIFLSKENKPCRN